MKSKQQLSSKDFVNNVRQIDGISNIAINVASVVQFHSVFSQQNKKHSDIDDSKLSYQFYLISLKPMLTSISKKILSRLHSGMKDTKQNKLEKGVKLARFLGLLPYVK